MMQGTFASESVLHQYIPSHVPRPLAWGNYASKPVRWFYLSAFHDFEDKIPGVHSVVSIVTQVHDASRGKSPTGKFGFHVPTHLGNVPSNNGWEASWETWFAKAMVRIMEIEEATHGRSKEIDSMKDALFKKVIPRLLRPLETNGRSVTPTLIHSDIHHDNVRYDASTGQTMLFDSCAFWGHNEAELATWRSERYQMGRAYIDDYVERMGASEPVEDFDDRNKLYWLRYEFLSSVLHAYNLVGRQRAVTQMRELVLKYPEGYIEDASNEK